MVMLNACSLNIHVYHIFHYKIVYKKIHIKYDLFHHGDEILLNVGAGLYIICTAVPNYGNSNSIWW